MYPCAGGMSFNVIDSARIHFDVLVEPLQKFYLIFARRISDAFILESIVVAFAVHECCVHTLGLGFSLQEDHANSFRTQITRRIIIEWSTLSVQRKNLKSASTESFVIKVLLFSFC